MEDKQSLCNNENIEVTQQDKFTDQDIEEIARKLRIYKKQQKQARREQRKAKFKNISSKGVCQVFFILLLGIISVATLFSGVALCILGIFITTLCNILVGIGCIVLGVISLLLAGTLMLFCYKVTQESNKHTLSLLVTAASSIAILEVVQQIIFQLFNALKGYLG
ncbi:MAG: hypothetical protein IJZ68_05525 [Bacteroidaceae bacterium]|nr:hypothetical protein [Bacteroidaceae bacterium]